MGFVPPVNPFRHRPTELIWRVEKATTRSDLNQFGSGSRYVYRGDHRWLPAFSSASRDALLPSHNPLLDSANLVAFLGRAQNLGLGDETVGRLAAWSTPEHEGDAGAWGCWGLFEAVNVAEVADRLFSEAENWLFEHTPGIAGIRGPCSIEPLRAPGLLTDGFNAQPLAFAPYNPPYYPEMVEGQGYQPGAIWRAYALDLHSAERARPTAPVTADAWRSIARAYIRPDEGADNSTDLIPGLVQWLSYLGGGAFGFNRAWRSAVGKIFRRVVAVIVAGKERPAVCFGVPDAGAALRLSGGRQFPVGWLLFDLGLRQARRLHVFPAAAPANWQLNQLADLYARVVQQAAGAGYRQMTIAPVSDDDERSVLALAAIGARPTQQFTIYEKT